MTIDLSTMDDADDNQWQSDGLPRLGAARRHTGKPYLTRVEIDATGRRRAKIEKPRKAPEPILELQVIDSRGRIRRDLSDEEIATVDLARREPLAMLLVAAETEANADAELKEAMEAKRGVDRAVLVAQQNLTLLKSRGRAEPGRIMEAAEARRIAATRAAIRGNAVASSVVSEREKADIAFNAKQEKKIVQATGRLGDLEQEATDCADAIRAATGLQKRAKADVAAAIAGWQKVTAPPPTHEQLVRAAAARSQALLLDRKLGKVAAPVQIPRSPLDQALHGRERGKSTRRAVR